MFTKLSPQKVRDTSGHIVQVASRHAIEYLEDDRRAMVEVEFGERVLIHSETLRDWLIADEKLQMEPEVRLEVLDRILSGVEAMGSKGEIV